MIGHIPALLAHAIWGCGCKVSGGCCDDPRLSCLEHPLYRCHKCGKKVQLVKVTTIKVKVVDESKEGQEKKQ